MIERRSAGHQSIMEVVRVLPAIDPVRIQSHGVGEFCQPGITIKLTPVVDEDFDAWCVVDQETAIEEFVEDSGSLEMLMLNMTKLGQELDRPVFGVELHPAAAQNWYSGTCDLKHYRQKNQSDGEKCCPRVDLPFLHLARRPKLEKVSAGTGQESGQPRVGKHLGQRQGGRDAEQGRVADPCRGLK